MTAIEIYTMTSASIFAEAIQLRYKSTDLSTQSTTTSSSSSSPTAASATSGSTATQAPASSGLSIGAKIAAGVIIPVAIIAIALAALLLVLRRRRRSAGGAPSELDSAGHPYPSSAMKKTLPAEAGELAVREPAGYELDSGRVMEQERPVSVVHELHGDGVPTTEESRPQ
jgi:hypothetical protein